jgi:type IV secretory pathway VirB6-like protein
MEIVVLIAVGIIALIIAFYLLRYLIVGAIILFAWATESGFVSVAAYFACWIFLFPFMIAGCIIVGAVIEWSNR